MKILELKTTFIKIKYLKGSVAGWKLQRKQSLNLKIYQLKIPNLKTEKQQIEQK